MIFVLRAIHTDVYVYRNQCHVTTFQLYIDTQFSHSIMIFHDLHDNEIWKNLIKHAWFTSVKNTTFYNFWWSCLVLISFECLLLYYNVNKISILFQFPSLNLGWFMAFNATFNNISVISCRSVLLVEETRLPRENLIEFKYHSCHI